LIFPKLDISAFFNMKLSLITFSLALLSQGCTAFVSQPSMVRNSMSLSAVKLTPEPEGGEELTPQSTMEGSRMKNMGEAEGVNDDDGTVYKFWLQATAQGALVKQLNTKVLKDASKKAEFPGFRKVRILQIIACLATYSDDFRKSNPFFVEQINRVKFLLTPCHKSVDLLFKRVLFKLSNLLSEPMD
jgi:hypothetical protein